MSHAIRSLDSFSTNVRRFTSLYGHRFTFGISSVLAPDLAGLLAEKVFLTPPRSTGRSPFELADGNARFIEFRGRSLATWTWGSESAPAVVLAHGWGGTAAQLKAFVAPLRAAGRRVIAYDQPAHGLSAGHLAGLPDFSAALEAVCRAHGNVRAVIAHSLGATATTLAIAAGVPLETVVLISPPDDLTAHSRRFARWMWIPERIRVLMQEAIEERFGIAWQALEATRLAPGLRARALIVHDRRDRVVPARQGRRLAEQWPGAALLLTDGLGHARILQAGPVVDASVAFIARGERVAGAVNPRLPDPSPIY